jgi:hypothetical protein
MAGLSPTRIAKAERRGPQREQRFVIEETIVEAVDGRMGRQYLAYRTESLPRKHPYMGVTIHFLVNESEFSSDPNFVVRWVWGARKGGPPGVVEIFDPPIATAELPTLDINAAVRWRVQYPSEFEPWTRQSQERWIRVLVRLARGATG